LVSNSQDKQQEIEEEGNAQSMEEVYQELKVFKDCTIEEFEDIFGNECNTNLPFYVNLYKLKEQYAYNELVDSKTNTYCMPAVILMNTAWYYYLRRTQPNTTLRFTSLKRTMGLTLLYNVVVHTFVTAP